jgi:hypothetical protein
MPSKRPAKRRDPIPVPDWDFEDEDRLVSTKNDSILTQSCLVWTGTAAAEAVARATEITGNSEGGHGLPLRNLAFFDLLPASVTATSAGTHHMTRKRRTAIEPNRESVEQLWTSVEAPGAKKPAHRGLRSIDTTRALLGDPKFLKSDGDDIGAAQSPRHHKRPCVMWEWQREHFDLRHEEHADVRSPLQVQQDAERQLERQRRLAFLQHLRHEAKYRPVNRVTLRRAPEGPMVSPPDHRPSTAPKRPPPLPRILPTAAIRGVRDADVPLVPAPPNRRDADTAGVADSGTRQAPAPPQRALSARVKQRIASLATEFLTPRSLVAADATG